MHAWGAFRPQNLACSITFRTKNPYEISEENEQLRMGWNPLYMLKKKLIGLVGGIIHEKVSS